MSTITVNIRAGKQDAGSPFDYALSQAASHEVVHAIRENAPAAYAKLECFLVEHYFPGMTLDYLV